MELRNMKSFIKVAEEGNFSRAAADLGYAQSTVSMQIRQLEEELGVPLFARSGKTVTLSGPGQAFLPYAYQMIRCEQMAVEQFQNPPQPQGLLRVGIMESICASPYADHLYSFMEKYPDVSVKFQVCTTYEAIDLLERGKLDVILLLDHTTTRPDWITAHTIPEQICFFCSADHPFAGRREVSLDELLGEQFLFVEEGCNYRHDFEQFLARKGKNVPCHMEIGHTRVLIDAVIRHLGISLLPRCNLLQDLKQGQIALIPLKEYSLEMFIQIIYNRDRWMPPALRAFIRVIRQMSL